MTELAVRVEGLSKRYRLGRGWQATTLREALTGWALRNLRNGRASGSSLGAPGGPAAAGDVWALKDVSFEVEKGETLGIIGPNGAGKSTLLKILGRITEPTEGRAEIWGRVGSLLEVGTGFHPELTGRENIYLSSAILGMKKAEIRRCFDDIVGFAGLEKFLDTPIKRYSSGMYVRLAFAVIAHLPTEVLLVDEVLAVGDAAFQFKCLRHMAEMTSAGRTVLFVSHNMEAISALCGRALLLQDGKIAYAGRPGDCVERYLRGVSAEKSAQPECMSLCQHAGRTKQHMGPVRLTSLSVIGGDGMPGWTVRCGDSIRIVLGYELAEGATPQDVIFSVIFSNLKNRRVTECVSSHTRLDEIRIKGAGFVSCGVRRLPLVPGIYTLTVGCLTQAGPSDGVYHVAQIEVVGGSFYPTNPVLNADSGDVLLEHEWELLDGHVEGNEV